MSDTTDGMRSSSGSFDEEFHGPEGVGLNNRDVSNRRSKLFEHMNQRVTTIL